MRVLVIEDEPQIADFLLRGLREEGFVVEHAADGQHAWSALQSAWDVVLLDWWLPGGDGLELLRRFRKLGRTAPVLFLTARDAVSDRVTGLDSGADDYLCKPFAFEELLARIRRMTRPPGQQPGTMLEYGDVQVDLAAHRALRQGHKLDLTTKEFSLLLFFVRHPEQVVSRTRIYEQVWDERFDGLSNTLEVHVVGLRRKLETHGGRLIHTVRGRGYRFGDDSAPARQGASER